MAYRTHGGEVESITCDFCLMDEFVPDMADDEDEAWEEAEEEGWTKVREGQKAILHCCPDCTYQRIQK